MDFKKCCVIFFVVASYFFAYLPFKLASMHASKYVQTEYAFEKGPPSSVSHILIWTPTPTLPCSEHRSMHLEKCPQRDTAVGGQLSALTLNLQGTHLPCLTHPQTDETSNEHSTAPCSESAHIHYLLSVGRGEHTCTA